MSDRFSFYDHGWDAAHRGEPYELTASIDWRDGWKDYHEAKPEDRRPFIALSASPSREPTK